jgi:hypothetical protein
MDCHGAARLAMTRQWGHYDLAPALPSRPVIARNEAIHRRSHENLDCHGAARLSMNLLF